MRHRQSCFQFSLITLLALLNYAALAASTDTKSAAPAAIGDSEKAGSKFEPFRAEAVTSSGSVTVAGRPITYQAVTGTLIVHPKGWDDVPRDPNDKSSGDNAAQAQNPTAEASMFYVAYFKTGEGVRPLTFLYNGGPGSPTMWLHMGAFGPRRVVTPTDSHATGAPYSIVNNASSLLDASDLVFIDAPGTGFSRIAGKDKEKAFWGVDVDAYAFAEFIQQFLSRYNRWNSPKYLFGESYGTPRSAVLANELAVDRAIDLNGVILLSQVLNFDLSPDGPNNNPGVDMPYIAALPTYAATAWYHHKLPGEHANLQALLTEVEQFAIGDYAHALALGSDLEPAQRTAIANKLHDYTGLNVEYINKANLRIDGGEFRQGLQSASDVTTGRLDTRFSGPDVDPLSERAQYDPQAAALSSAYAAAFNAYVRNELHYSADQTFKPRIQTRWNWTHVLSDQATSRQGTNVMGDLANVMKQNPTLKVMLNAGYYDLATPFYQGVYEMRHLPIPQNLASNIEFKFYESGHMVYAREASLKEMHDNVAEFIYRTSGATTEPAVPVAVADTPRNP
jgi:carboxypeptidase C (cathepsin A)